MSTGAKVGIGCGIFLIIGVIILVLLVGWCQRSVGHLVRYFAENPERATAEMIVRMNPELDLVSTDDEAGTITFRDSEGKETTVSWSDLAEGRLTVTDSDGNELVLGVGDMENVPAWVPRLPDTNREVGAHHQIEEGTISGSYMAMTDMETVAIRLFFDTEAQALGMSSSADTSNIVTDSQEMNVFSYRGTDGRSFNATVMRQPGGEAQVTIVYEEKPGS